MLKDTLRRYFIPNEQNNYEPHILQKAALGVMLFLVVVTFAVSNIQALVLVSSQWFVSTVLPSVIVELTNENRDDERLDMLVRSPILDRAAQLKAEDMAKKEYFAHNSPEGVTPWYWFEEVGYTYSHAGENLAVHFTDSKELVDAWMDSPGHRANIMDADYTEIGIGTAQGEYKGFPTVFVVQMFGRPAVAPAPQPLAVAPTPAEEPAEEVLALAEEEPAGEENELAVQGAQDDEGVPSDTEGPASSTADVSEGVPTDVEPVAEEAPELPVAESADVAEVTFVPTSPVMYLEEMATTSGYIPVEAAAGIQSQNNGGSTLNTLNRIATQPTRLLTAIYSLLAMFVIVCLTLSIAIEWRHQRPVQVAYGTGLLALMALMWYVQDALVSGALIT